MRISACVVLSFLLLTTLAAADPGAVMWSGGTVSLIDEHPTVSLVEETIILEPRLSDTLVSVDLQFHNTGEARAVPMGFPTLKFGGPGYHFVRDFTVEANGQPLPVTVQEEAAQIQLGERSHDCVWHLFEVPFAADADLTMRVRYREAREYSWNMLQVPYVLATGASWKGDVRRVDLEVRFPDRRNFSDVNLAVGQSPTWQPLDVERDGDIIRWRAADYSGTPQVILLSAMLGPTAVTDDADLKRSHWGTLAWWEDDRVLLEADYLADCLLAMIAGRAEDTLTLAKEGREVELALKKIEGEFMPQTIEFVEPQGALEAFGGSLVTSTDADGDLAISITTAPQTAEAAQATARCAEQTLDYRRRALRRLAERWPDACAEVCDTILSRDSEQTAVLAWAVGRTQASGARVDELETLVNRVGGDWRAELTEAVLTAQTDEELRGGVAMVPEQTRGSMAARLVSGISACEDWQQGVHRARNAGLALRLMDAPDACRMVRNAIIAGEGHQDSEDALLALGFLGDDEGIPTMVLTAVGDAAASRDLQCAAAAAPGYLGTRAGMEACLEIWRRAEDREVQARAWRGIEIACDTDYYRAGYFPGDLPLWAREISPQDARALCREWLDELAAEEQDRSRSGDMERLRRGLASAQTD